MREVILYGIIVIAGLVAVNGVGVTTFLLGEHLFHNQEIGPTTNAEANTTDWMNRYSSEVTAQSESDDC